MNGAFEAVEHSTPARRDDFNGLSYSFPHTSHVGIDIHPFSAGQIQPLGGAALMSASAERLSRSMARSPRVTMPTAVSPLHTGTGRREVCRHRWIARSMLSDGASATRPPPA